MLAIVALSSCGPNFNSTDRDFERKVQAVVYERPLGTIPSDESADVLRTLFQSNVDHVCIVGGGDFAVDVRDQWSAASNMPITADELRNVASGDVSYDGAAALVGVDQERGVGHVRRAWFMGECTDYGGVVCVPTSELQMSIIESTLFDAGPNAGRRARGLRLADAGHASCALQVVGPIPQLHTKIPRAIKAAHKIYPTPPNPSDNALVPRTGGSLASRAARTRGTGSSVRQPA